MRIALHPAICGRQPGNEGMCANADGGFRLLKPQRGASAGWKGLQLLHRET